MFSGGTERCKRSMLESLGRFGERQSGNVLVSFAGKPDIAVLKTERSGEGIPEYLPRLHTCDPPHQLVYDNAP